MLGKAAARRLIVVLIGALVLAGCGANLPPGVKQGTTVTDAGLTMTVISTWTTTGRDPDYSWAGSLAPSRTVVFVKLHVSADGAKPALFDPMFQQLFFDGSEYEPNPRSAELLNEMMKSNAVSGASLSPGSEADVTLVFQIPWESDPFAKPPVQLVLRGDLNSPGVVVDLTVR